MVTIVIPTQNRHAFLHRLLAYYAGTDSPYPILIGDSSHPKELYRTAELAQGYGQQFPLTYRPFPTGTGMYEVTHGLLKEVSTPYAVLLSDDDFLIPARLKQIADFLEDHPDYNIAHGQAVLVRLNSNGAHGVMKWTEKYGEPSVEWPSARQRLLQRRWGTVFSLHRTQAIRTAYQEVVSLQLDTNFAQLLTGGLNAIWGKSKQLDLLYMVRQVHSGQHSVRASRVCGLSDWLADPGWAGQYSRFGLCLARELAKTDSLSPEEAQGLVQQAFGLYLVDLLQPESHSHPGKRLWASLVEVAERFPALRSMGYRLRAWLVGQEPAFSLAALLRSSSSYHADFLPIYEAMTHHVG